MAIDFNDAPRQQSPMFEDAEARRNRISAGLRHRVRDLVRYLYPKAIFSAQDARIGDVSGARGGSMSIALAPFDKAGMWIDHADQEKGDALTLWARAHGLDPVRDFARVLTECEGWLGGAPPVHTPHTAQRPAAKAEPEDDHRSGKTLERIYVYRAPDGSQLGVEQRRYKTADGGKTFVPFVNGSPGMPPHSRPLYGMERWHDQPALVLVEGEKCADALMSIGIPAATAMGGANTTIEKTDWSPLAGKTVILWPDHDYPRPKTGLQPGYELMKRLKPWLQALGCTVREVTPPQDKPDGWDAADAIAEGFDVQAFLAEPAKPSDDQSILWEPWEAIRFQYEPELVEDLLPQVGLATIFGPSTVGKSFVTLDWATSIATGRPMFGKETAAAGILYLAFEGYYGLRKRIHGLKQEKGLPQVALELVDAPWTLSDPEDHPGFLAFVRAAKARLEDTGFGLGVIVIDTLTAAYAGADANAQADVTRAMRQLKRLAMDLQCLVLVIGHTGKDTTRGMVGSFAYKSESDAFIELRAEKDEQDGSVTGRSVYIDKVKDGASDYVLADYDLREIRIGTKPNGKPVTTCVIDWKTPAQKRKPEQKGGGEVYSGAYLRIIELLREEPKTTGELAASLSIHRTGISRKLNALQEDGVIFARDDGPRKIWVLCNDPLHTHTDENQGSK